MEFLLGPLALLIERAIGYPRPLLAIIRHPVMWMGALIAWLEARLNTGEQRRLKGVVMLLLLLGTVLAVSLLLIAITRRIPFGFVLEAVISSSLLAQMSLGQAVKAVADGLGLSLDSGRRAVSHIVGRDPDALDESGVARAAIESLAESTSDGVIAPLFWLLIGGLPGIVLYKAINTADSMVGHRDARYAEFGWASARLDDIVNWIPARISALLIGAASFLVRGADPEAALGSALRDARKHASPNAGWPEAAFAGALGLALGGPRAYAGEIHDLPEFGDGRRDLNALDILKSLELYWMVLNVTLGMTFAIALILWWRLG
ncbi:MAG TPA: adenosylcobinamide-phosphate synthase CbiB [Devosia sp.]|nr:adenosylcobinamide-phosphate synthase CbiB [Devosia sp.]